MLVLRFVRGLSQHVVRLAAHETKWFDLLDHQSEMDPIKRECNCITDVLKQHRTRMVRFSLCGSEELETAIKKRTNETSAPN